MKPLQLLALSTAIAALLIFAATEAGALQRPVNSGPRITLPSHANHFSWEGQHHRFRGGSGGFHGGVLIVEREVPVIVEREVPAPPPPAAAANLGTLNGNSGTPNRDVPELPRKPYVIGGTYASLPPQGCMKLIEDGTSYYFCGGGEWYRPLGEGRDSKYWAVAKP